MDDSEKEILSQNCYELYFLRKRNHLCVICREPLRETKAVYCTACSAKRKEWLRTVCENNLPFLTKRR